MAHEHLWQNETFRTAFQRWWDEDWSWNGLAKEFRQRSLGHLPNETSGTLQDEWRNEQGRLIEFGGRKWTRFHLPPFDRNGNPCPAGLWNDAKNASCREVLAARLEAANAPDEAALKKYGLEAVTSFAELRGVVFPGGVDFDGEMLIANLQSAIFFEGFSYTKRLLARFGLATFSGDAGFEGATFSGTARFAGTTFSGGVGFRGAMFSGDALFVRATFSGVALFDGATFSGDAMFVRATFSGYARFRDATFSGAAVFGGTAPFTRPVSFRSVPFEGAKFSGDAGFEGATFSGNARFEDATFSGDAVFLRATFSRGVGFRGATFFGTARFDGTTPFARQVSFRSVRFRRGANFSGREFKGRTDFINARFAGVPKFHGAKLHPDTSFLDAKFRDGTDGRDLPGRRSGWFGFRRLEYKEDRAGYEQARKEWKSKLRVYLRWRKVPFGLHRPELKDIRKSHDADAEEYEIAYRQLRRLCAEIGSIEYEGMFHALELRAHRARTDTQLMARAAAWAYEKLSDYGRSMGRPILWLLAAWGAFATVYLLILTPPYSAEACTGVGWPSRLEILVAAAREFLPSLFGVANISNQPEWLRCGEGAHPFWFFILSVAQIVIFIALVSLFLIALRRRFRLRD